MSRRSAKKGAKVVRLDTSRVGIAEHFRVGERARATRVLEDLRALGVRDVRVGVSWADSMTPEGADFYRWLLPALATHARVVPCIAHTPPSLGLEPRCAAPPREPRHFADWLDVFLTEHGASFEHVELWNAPNTSDGWDRGLDPELRRFVETVGVAAAWARARGKKTVLGGLRPADPAFLRRLADEDALHLFDVIGVQVVREGDARHDAMRDRDALGEAWRAPVRRTREALTALGSDAGVWITEGGFSTWRNDEGRQLAELLAALESGADRVYWSSLHDVPEEVPAASGFHVDERDYHFGLKRADGTPKLAFRLWADGGLENVRAHEFLLRRPPSRRRARRVSLVTGGAGFIGSNLANRLLEEGDEVLVLDNLSRPGIERNVRWLRETHGDRMSLSLGDVRDPFLVDAAVARADRVFHFAAQVAVTTSLVAPRHDFSVNAGGTLNVLEALRRRSSPPPLLFTSTNKVYGGLPDVGLEKRGTRYEPADPHLAAHGVSEERPLDFHSPYGCSKGVADQYILDYARCFELPTAVFRMSCIYGPRQFGNEEQGWVAHFVRQALRGEPITLYGDGLQVRDVLYVGDLVEAFLLASEHMDAVRGHAFNVGGGPENTLSLVELLSAIESMTARRPVVRFGDWRAGDQRYYCSDYRKLQRMTGWRPVTTVEQGLERLRDWLAPMESGAAPSRVIARASGDGVEG